MRVLILGAGGHGQVIADCLSKQAEQGTDVSVAGFLDDNPALAGSVIGGVPVLGRTNELDRTPHDAIVIGIGNNTPRAALYSRLVASGEHFHKVIHPRAIVANHVKIGPGTVVFPGAVINTGAEIGENVIINTGATVDHHCRISNHVHIAPGVHLGGGVIIAEGAFLGIGVCVIPYQQIGEWTVVGSGAVVIRNIPGKTKVVGVPAREINSNQLSM